MKTAKKILSSLLIMLCVSFFCGCHAQYRPSEKEKAYEKGYEEGYKEGYDAGFDNGEAEGYDSGYYDGYYDATNN